MLFSQIVPLFKFSFKVWVWDRGGKYLFIEGKYLIIEIKD